jgi:putative ABC transport system ATP-binding protein
MSLSDRADRGGDAITPASKDVIVEMEGVGKSYRTGEVVAQVLRDVNLRIARDELVVMFGVSGCGKTTLLNLLGALDTPSAGTIVVDGEAISSMTERARTRFRATKVGFVFQFYNLLPTLTALENVEAALEILPLKSAEIRRRGVHYLSAVGMEDKLAKFPAQLSGGEQQRVAIARALAKEPPLILADEPTGNLDEGTGLEVMRVMSDLRRRTGATMVVVTHNPRLTAFAGRVLRIERGRIQGSGDPAAAAP